MHIGWSTNLLFFLSLFFSQVLATSERFDEELTLRPLRDGKLAARFSFTTLLKGATPRNPESLASDDESQHYTLFPLALGQILREYAVTELHLSLNAGNWNYDTWGYPDKPGVGTGAELWVWMGDGAPISVDDRWQGLRNALAGLFCASLGSLDEQRTTSPTLSFQPEGSLPDWKAPHQLRHATLPSEHVCTENLTPFLKLLPCKSLSGIARLLNPHRLFDADWHGLGVNVRYHQNAGVEVRLTFQAVFDPVRLSPNKRRDWSLDSIFDRTIDRACPVAHSSEVRVELPGEKLYTLSPDPSVIIEDLAIFVVKDTQDALDIAMEWPGEATFSYPLFAAAEPLTHMSVQRTLKGSSQSDARLSLVITNNLPVQVQTGYLETMPWLAQFYLHTLRVRSDGVSRDDLVTIISYAAPVPHARPTLFQAALTLPPKSTLEVTMDVLKPFLRYTEHPPDALRGWDLPPAVLGPFSFGNLSDADLNISAAALTTLRRQPRRIYTSTLLVDLATPDFSMPYNVIIISCTLIALIFGSVFNLLTRKFVVVSVENESGAGKSDLS
ncbi:GPI transamidase component PIG-T homolog [Sparassis crispa]|uniref:GPI transamidase component PIG-T homolog n=1 Tax=Sparassis crispa TaxID=139825 RepID=A0A401H752_9APHY|nr:GPI transamidase component PIG-T homolog [Sparassis crispa]GBE90200.1 GPI transamidase component PIG-T homolog [Sparassis crispa]